MVSGYLAVPPIQERKVEQKHEWEREVKDRLTVRVMEGVG